MKNLINPFENDIVSEPRRAEKPVSGLNKTPLDELIERFGELEETPLPRSGKLSHAQFVVSPQPGYGKSHLIGRLFRNLSGRATLVYLRPFEDGATCWKSVLLKMVQELNFPDNVDMESADRKDPTQLEAFAHGILIHLLTDLVKAGAIQIKKNKNRIGVSGKCHCGKIQKK